MSTLIISSVRSLSHVWLFVTPWTAACQASLSITNAWSLLRLRSVWVSDAIQPSHSLSSPSPPAPIPPSTRVFSNESVLHIWWPKYWSCSFNISPSNEYSGLISFRMDWLDLFSNTTIQKHQFFGTQFSLWSNSHISTWLLEKPYVWLYGPCKITLKESKFYWSGGSILGSVTVKSLSRVRLFATP